MLTEEEKIVLILIGQGETHQTICRDREITDYQLRRLKKSIIRKTGARNIVHALYLTVKRDRRYLRSE